MTDLGAEFFVVAAVVVFLTGVSKSGFAAGFEALGVPIFAFYMSPALAAGILLPILILVDATNLWNYRKLWDWRILRLLLPAAAVGIVIGTVCVSYVTVDLIRLMVGAIALWFAGLFWLRSVVPRLWGGGVMGPKAGFILGCISGFTSHIAHAGGPPMRAYLLTQNLNKSVFMGTNSVYFYVVNLIKLVPYLMIGQINMESLKLSAAFVPVVLLGVLVGVTLHKKVSQQLFTQLAYGFLLLAGIKLVLDSALAIL